MNNALESNTCEITRSKANGENLSSNATNLPLIHAISRVLEGSFWISFLDNELKSTRSGGSKEGHNFSHIIDMRERNKMIVNQE